MDQVAESVYEDEVTDSEVFLQSLADGAYELVGPHDVEFPENRLLTGHFSISPWLDKQFYFGGISVIRG